MRLVIMVIIVVALFLNMVPGLCSQKVVSLRDYNATLDFGDKEVAVEPMHSSSTLDTVSHFITFRGENESDYAMVCIYEYTSSAFDLRDRLWSFMKSYCTMVDIDPAIISGTSGFIATGKARVLRGFSKQVCYGGIAALPSSAEAQRDFMILAHFNDAALNEYLVKTSQVEYTGKVIKV